MDGRCRPFPNLRSAAPRLVFLAVLTYYVGSSCAGLYDKSSPLQILNSTNFYSVLLQKENAWFVQFYNSWCGHCIKYAPVFKTFADDITGWQPVLGLAVVDCSDLDNLKLCRTYNVNSYPTLLFLWARATAEDRGEELMNRHTPEGLRHLAIDLLEGNHTLGPRQKPESWPSLDPLPNNITLAQLWLKVPAEVERLYLVVEDHDSYVGREIILDLASSPKRRAWRIGLHSPGSVLLQELPKPSDPEQLWSTAMATVYTVPRDGSASLLCSVPKGQDPRPLVRSALRSISTGVQGADLPGGIYTGSEPLADLSKVYQADLDNALAYALRQEVALHKALNQSQLQVLGRFVHILAQFFPGNASTMRFLGDLEGFLSSHQESGLRGEDISVFLNSRESDDSRLPAVQSYIGCRGSRPELRGYPCALWMLFHSLTVNAYIAQPTAAGGTKTNLVTSLTSPSAASLLAVRDYVVHFFTCRECSNHFATMAEGMEAQLREPQDAVLWLWKAHNAVNKRLAGDRSEDPMHPKKPFPPVALCRGCRVPNQSELHWDEQQTLHFLLSFYGRDAVVQTAEPGTWQQVTGAFWTPSTLAGALLAVPLAIALLLALAAPLSCGLRRLRIKVCRALCARHVVPSLA